LGAQFCVRKRRTMGTTWQEGRAREARRKKGGAEDLGGPDANYRKTEIGKLFFSVRGGKRVSWSWGPEGRAGFHKGPFQWDKRSKDDRNFGRGKNETDFLGESRGRRE